MSTNLEHHLRDVRSQRVTFGPGQYLFHLGDRVRVMYFVRTGLVHLIRTQNNGAVLVLQQARPGSILAEASFCSDVYHCDAVASEETHGFAYAATDFRARLRSTPDFADAWAAHLAHELQLARSQAEILSLKTVAQRLDAWIAWHGGVFPRKGEWGTIASEIGVTPEALYREIAKRRPSSKSNNRHGDRLPV
jgi:CRP-like cAMP-binding protein